MIIQFAQAWADGFSKRHVSGFQPSISSRILARAVMDRAFGPEKHRA
jgi:hypothetical protein